MASRREIRRRIRSIQNTAQITKAMQMVAASRMRRAQARVQAARPYAESITEIMADIAARPGAADHPLLTQRELRRIEIVAVGSDRGLAGAYVANLNREIARVMQRSPEPARVIAVGRRPRDFVLRTRATLVADYSGLGDHASIVDIRPVAEQAVEDYQSGEADLVYLVYTEFISTLRQQAQAVQLLPVLAPTENVVTGPWNYEPDNPGLVLQDLVPRYVEFSIYRGYLEAQASYHTAQMLAMSNATDNALEIVKDLTLEMNKARQAEITKEIAEISGGAEAIQATGT
ncbi:MAG TPA: ATP synthase F1 subunit gamma [Chloroflexota bacterium]|nr:ATP synthase F1 subunit gamma [Chloroflexota bacterium]